MFEFTKNRTSPFTSKEVCTRIKRTQGWNISKEAAIKIMKEHCRLFYKKGKSSQLGVNIVKQKLLKQYFAVKISQSILNYEVLINIDETTFSRDTKITHSWLLKERDSELMNIWYSNSTSSITSITSLWKYSLFQQWVQ